MLQDKGRFKEAEPEWQRKPKGHPCPSHLYSTLAGSRNLGFKATRAPEFGGWRRIHIVLKGQLSLQLTFGLYIFAFIAEKQPNIEISSPWVIFLMQKKGKKEGSLFCYSNFDLLFLL